MRPAPKQWLDDYFMKNFIRLSLFDDTLVTGEGEMETGWSVTAASVQEHLEQWLRGRKMIGPETRLEISER